MRKTKGTNEKIEHMEAERQRRIDALPQIQRWDMDRFIRKNMDRYLEL